VQLKLYIMEYETGHSTYLVPFYAPTDETGREQAEEWAKEHDVEITAFNHFPHGLVIYRTRLPGELEME
jgi:hypothetical protein